MATPRFRGTAATERRVAADARTGTFRASARNIAAAFGRRAAPSQSRAGGRRAASAGGGRSSGS